MWKIVHEHSRKELAALPYLAEVVGAKHLGAAFTLASDQLGRVDLHEAPGHQRLAEEQRDATADAHDCVVGGHAQVQPAVVQAHVLQGRGNPDVHQQNGNKLLLHQPYVK